MSINIKVPDETFNFSELTLGDPLSIMNGFYFSSIKHSDDLYIQTPHVSCKSGFVKSSNKHHMDIVLKQDDETLLAWFENLENRIKILIYEKRNDWFNESNIEMSDIENIFISPIRSYKSGKQFTLRAHVESAKTSMINHKEMKIFDMNYNSLSIDDVNNESEFIALLHISGVKFSSRTFQIYTEVKQIMIMNKTDMFSSCLIKAPVESISNASPIKPDVPDVDENLQQITETDSKHAEDKEKSIEQQEDVQETITTSKDEWQKTIEDIEKEVDQEVKETQETQATQETSETQEVHENETMELEDKATSLIENDKRELSVETLEVSQIPESSIELQETQIEDMETQRDINTEKDTDKDTDVETIDDKNTDIHEFNVNFQTLEDSDIQLQEPELEHVEKYKNAVRKAKELRKEALQSHLEAQNIKAKYLLNVYSDSDSDESIEVGEE